MFKNNLLLLGLFLISIYSYGQSYKDYTTKEYLSLTDEVHLLTLFVDTDKDYWEGKEVDYYYDQLLMSQEWIQEQALDYGKEVEFNNDYFFTDNKNVVYIDEVKIGNHPKKTIQKLMEKIGYENLNDFFNRNKFDFQKKKFKILIFVKDESRSHAYNYWSVKDVDLAVVYCKSTYGMMTSHYVISHEMLHQFGAWDLYKGKSQTLENAQKARELYPYSVMISTRYDPSLINVDELTAWKIGWGDYKEEFRQFDPQYTLEDRVKESRGNTGSIKFDLRKKKKNKQ